ESKKRLIRFVKRLNKKAVPKAIIANADDRNFKHLKTDSFNSISYGISQKADVAAKSIKLSESGNCFKLVTGKWETEINSRLPALFNVYNCLAAASVGVLLGIDKKTIKRGIEKVTNVSGRMEKIPFKKGARVIVDFAHTPESLENVLRFFRCLTKNRLITVFGCGGNSTVKKRMLMGKVASKYSDIIYLTSENPYYENSLKILKDIEKGMPKKVLQHKKCIKVVGRKNAIKAALLNARKGDTVVIAGKGHEKYIHMQGKKIPADDKEAVTSAIKALGG
ncbi:MAG: cyanophycin synthetase, partial [Candidatus Diapherotrites archaeon]|nr:cyanophycin synthetase [Candidatus Diapherotrites archaeon]